VLACLHTVQEKAVEPETLIELTEEDLSQIAGGQFGFALFSLPENSAKGGHTASVTAAVAQTTTITSATQAAIVTSFSA
jgi:hypothetical protein